MRGNGGETCGGENFRVVFRVKTGAETCEIVELRNTPRSSRKLSLGRAGIMLFRLVVIPTTRLPL